MAADTRPYKSKEQDGQGNELIIRDQQLVEQDTTTTMPTGTCFQTIDVDGRPVKIPKANMVDIVREALGTLLNGLSDQTTVTKVPSLNGNTLGASTVATLASVLGVNDYDTHLMNWVKFNQVPSPFIICTMGGSGSVVIDCQNAHSLNGNYEFTRYHVSFYYDGSVYRHQCHKAILGSNAEAVEYIGVHENKVYWCVGVDSASCLYPIIQFLGGNSALSFTHVDSLPSGIVKY